MKKITLPRNENPEVFSPRSALEAVLRDGARKLLQEAIENEVSDLQGVQTVKAEIESKKVVITFETPADEQKIKDLLAEINYPVEELIQL